MPFYLDNFGMVWGWRGPLRCAVFWVSASEDHSESSLSPASSKTQSSSALMLNIVGTIAPNLAISETLIVAGQVCGWHSLVFMTPIDLVHDHDNCFRYRRQWASDMQQTMMMVSGSDECVGSEGFAESLLRLCRPSRLFWRMVYGFG